MKIRGLLGVFCLAVSMCPVVVMASTGDEKIDELLEWIKSLAWF